MELRVPTIKGYLESRNQIAENTLELWIKLEHEFVFEAGQYVWLTLKELKYPDDSGNQRAFSIASSPLEKQRIRILYRQSESGYKRTIAESEIGLEVEVLGPFGFFTLPKEPKDVLFIAGGVGVAPFISIIEYAVSTSQPNQIQLLVCNKAKETAVEADRLDSLSRNHANVVCMSKIGRFEIADFEAIKDLHSKVIYISGPKAMTVAVTKQLLQVGVNRNLLVFDEFYGLGLASDNSDALESLIEKTIQIDEFRLAVQGSMEHMIITDINGHIRYANKAAENMTGYTLMEMQFKTPRLWGGLMEKKVYDDMWKRIKIDQLPFETELKNRRKTGEIYIAKTRISPIKNDQGDIIAFVGHEDDITKQKMVMEELEREKIKAEALLFNMTEGVVSLDTEGKITFINRAALEMLGYDQNEMLGKKWTVELPITLDVKGKVVTTNDDFCFSGNEDKPPIRVEYFLQRKDGSTFLAQMMSKPILLGNGLSGSELVFYDISKEKELDRAKDEFISIASHELRTPLTAIDGIVSMILEGDYGPIDDEMKKALVDINISSERLIHLVNDLLNLSKINAGKLKYSISVFNLSELVSRVTNLFVTVCKKKNITITSQTPQEYLVQADPDKVEQVIVNLVNNAIKFTDSGSISIDVSNVDQMALIKIADTGVGISQENQGKLFGRFMQIGKQKDRPSGTGLGLYLSKEMIQKMGGDLWLYASSPNQGSTFAFTLPYPNTAPAAKAQDSITAADLNMDK